jgi:iron complex transport system substrate-binding protein
MFIRKRAGELAGAVLLSLALPLAVACSSNDSSTDSVTESDPAADAAVSPGSDTSLIDGEVPTRIISLSPTHTEMLFAIGAADQVIAVDDFSNYPAEAVDKQVGLSAFEPNIEGIAELDPDLVVTEGTNPALLEQLASLGIATYAGLAPSTFDEVFEQILELGAVTGNEAGAEKVVGEMRVEIEEITESLPELDSPLTYYHELDPSYFSVTSDTFIGYVYSQLGLRSIADLVETSAAGYPQLNAEFILDSDPDLIFLACTKYCSETAETVAARPGWGNLTAAQNGLIFEMDDDVASRWGPRIVDYYRAVAEAITSLQQRSAAA